MEKEQKYLKYAKTIIGSVGSVLIYHNIGGWALLGIVLLIWANNFDFVKKQ